LQLGKRLRKRAVAKARREHVPARMAPGEQSGARCVGSHDTTRGGEKPIQAVGSGLGIDQRAKYFISTLDYASTYLGAVLANFQLDQLLGDVRQSLGVVRHGLAGRSDSRGSLFDTLLAALEGAKTGT